MSLSRFYKGLEIALAKVRQAVGRKVLRELPRIQLIPVIQTTSIDPLRTKEIADLAARIVMIGKKRGRPSKHEEEVQDAA